MRTGKVFSRNILVMVGLPLLAAAIVTAAAIAISPSEPSNGSAHVADFLQQASDSQRQAFADGEITADEYRAATDAFVSCMEESIPGVVITRHPVAGGRQVFEMTYDAGRISEGHRANHECWVQHLDAIDRIWSEITRPDEAYIQSARNALAECLQRDGLTISRSPSQLEFVEILRQVVAGTVEKRVVGECSAEISEKFQLPGFFG
jgi:hypothetical protein